MRIEHLTVKLYNVIKRITFTGLIVASAVFICNVPGYAMDFAIIMRLGYSPHAGGSMSSGWQRESLGVRNGLYDINRSSENFDEATIEVPLGVVAAFETMFTWDLFYFKTGIWSLYTIAGGTGKTVDMADANLYNVSYQQWSVDVPLTAGVNLLYWGESRIYLGCGAAFAYGGSIMSFDSATDHTAMFAGFAFPLVAELGCEYMTGDKTSIGCGIRYMYGKTSVVENGSDYAVVDFSGFMFTLSAAVHLGSVGAL